LCEDIEVRKQERRCMTITHPELAAEFDLVLNAPKTPEKIVAGTGSKIFWRCRNCLHSWRARGADRVGVGQQGCPACCNHVVNNYDGRNSLASARPDMALEFDEESNAGLTTRMVTAGTSLKLGWKCLKCQHRWVATGNGRIYSKGKGRDCPKIGGCPSCANDVINNFDGRNAISNTHPELAAEFDAERNWPNTVLNTVAGTNMKIFWKCSTCAHKWSATGGNRSIAEINSGCPVCNRQYTASEHLSNMYVVCFLRGMYDVDIDPETSRIPKKEGRAFQVDCRIYRDRTLIAAYLYDGLAGHQDTERSKGKDLSRRESLCEYVPKVLVHRHGMAALPVSKQNYIEAVTGSRSSILSGVEAVLTLWLGEVSRICLKDTFSETLRTWSEMSKANMQKMQSLLQQERRALQREGVEVSLEATKFRGSQKDVERV
jgi:cytochrome c2